MLNLTYAGDLKKKTRKKKMKKRSLQNAKQDQSNKTHTKQSSHAHTNF